MDIDKPTREADTVTLKTLIGGCVLVIFALIFAGMFNARIHSEKLKERREYFFRLQQFQRDVIEVLKDGNPEIEKLTPPKVPI